MVEREYVLIILMDLAKEDLDKMQLKVDHKPMEFEQFFPIFKDAILGVVYMHSRAIVHRDIKPENILKMDSGKFVLVDYGIGINLDGEERYNENNPQYQVGKW